MCRSENRLQNWPLLPCQFWGSDLCHHACGQGPLPAEPSSKPYKLLLLLFLMQCHMQASNRLYYCYDSELIMSIKDILRSKVTLYYIYILQYLCFISSELQYCFTSELNYLFVIKRKLKFTSLHNFSPCKFSDSSKDSRLGSLLRREMLVVFLTSLKLIDTT